MLDTMRRAAGSRVAKGLLLLLVVSFAIWGIGDVFRTSGVTSDVAEVADIPISQNELRQDADFAFRRLQQQLGGNLERTDAIMEGLYRQALQQAIARRLLDAHAQALGLAVADETLVRMVREERAFQTGGEFDRGRFEMFLRESGMSEQGYLQQLAHDITRERLISAVTDAATAPQTLARRLAAWRGEQRKGRALIVDAGAIEVPAPDDATLQAWLEAHRSEYQAPELRGVEIAILSAEDLTDEVVVSEDELKAEYEARIGNYRTPERRWVVQLLATDKATIEEAAKRVAAGESFAAVADALAEKGVSTTELGPVTKGELPDELDRAVFALAPDQPSAPVESLFGWHLLRLVRGEPETTRPLNEVRGDLERELRLRKAAERLPDVETALEDALAGGASLEQAAQQTGARLHRIDAIDRRGRDAAGNPIESPALSEEMLAGIFDAGANQPSLVEQTRDDRYYAFAVTRIAPARPRRLDEVREQVAEAWKRDQQLAQAKQRAAELLARAKSGTSLDTLAASGPGVSLRAVGPLTRDDPGLPSLLSREAVAALFATPPGELAKEPVPVREGAALVATDEVIPADVQKDAEAIAQALRQDLRSDLLAQYQAALEARFPVEINERALQSMVQTASR